MIFYYSLNTHGQEYKPLIEKYGLLSVLKARLTPFILWCREGLYTDSAFEEKQDAVT